MLFGTDTCSRRSTGVTHKGWWRVNRQGVLLVRERENWQLGGAHKIIPVMVYLFICLVGKYIISSACLKWLSFFEDSWDQSSYSESHHYLTSWNTGKWNQNWNSTNPCDFCIQQSQDWNSGAPREMKRTGRVGAMLHPMRRCTLEDPQGEEEGGKEFLLFCKFCRRIITFS